jgi:hypothetical protein
MKADKKIAEDQVCDIPARFWVLEYLPAGQNGLLLIVIKMV